MKFVVYKQFNSTGVTLHAGSLGDYIVFEVPETTDTSEEKFHEDPEIAMLFDDMLFDPLGNNDTDCPCCGPRWKRIGVFDSRSQAKKSINTVEKKCDSMYSEKYVVWVQSSRGGWIISWKGKVPKETLSKPMLLEELYKLRQRSLVEQCAIDRFESVSTHYFTYSKKTKPINLIPPRLPAFETIAP
jgi:hypothetical protein